MKFSAVLWIGTGISSRKARQKRAEADARPEVPVGSGETVSTHWIWISMIKVKIFLHWNHQIGSPIHRIKLNESFNHDMRAQF